MKKFAIGDIHGNFKAFKQCLERSSFDFENDELICLGDMTDGYPEVKECFDLFLTIKNRSYILGNHDFWSLEWATKGIKDDIWVSQGGASTIKSYEGKMVEEHLKVLKEAHLCLEVVTDSAKRLFVHGGIDPNQKNLAKQDPDTCLWDRRLFENAKKSHCSKPDYKYAGYDEIFIGHTTTQRYGSSVPLHYCNIWNLDTGAGWFGRLTIMNIETKEFFQSDWSEDLYPEGNGRY